MESLRWRRPVTVYGQVRAVLSACEASAELLLLLLSKEPKAGGLGAQDLTPALPSSDLSHRKWEINLMLEAGVHRLLRL